MTLKLVGEEQKEETPAQSLEERQKLFEYFDQALLEIKNQVEDLRSTMKKTLLKDDKYTFPNFLGVMLESNFQVNTWFVGTRAFQRCVQMQEKGEHFNPQDILMDEVIKLKQEEIKRFGFNSETLEGEDNGSK